MGEDAGLPHGEPDPYEVVQAQRVVGARRRRWAASWQFWVVLGGVDLLAAVLFLMDGSWGRTAILLAVAALYFSTAVRVFRRRLRGTPATPPERPPGA